MSTTFNTLYIISSLLMSPSHIANSCDWNSSCYTPPATEGCFYDPNAGQQMYRTVPVKRASNGIYPDNILTTEEFKTHKGYVSPSKYA